MQMKLFKLLEVLGELEVSPEKHNMYICSFRQHFCVAREKRKKLKQEDL